jgi:carbonic anhydrase/acetyltransferase-like protein (isoleucine patch superfamily)
MASILTYRGKTPRIHPSAFIAPGAQIIGDVEIGPDSSVWYNCVLRGDVNTIRIGARSNIQDGTVIHVDSARPENPAGNPTIIGDDVLIGHMVMLHGSVLHDGAFVGLGSVVMDSVIEGDGMLAAGALLSPGKTIGRGELWIGRPAKKLRDLGVEDIARNRTGSARYVELARHHAASLAGGGA